MTIRERVTHGDLPHWYRPGCAHFVTYRLAGSIPASLLRRWRRERSAVIERPPPTGATLLEQRRLAHRRFFAQYDECLDSSTTVRWLAEPRVAEIVRENLYHHHGTKYELLAWCVMPNHVHVLLQPFDQAETTAPESLAAGSDLSDEVPDGSGPLAGIMHSLKSFTANRANEVLGRRGQFWQHESYDHWVRDLDELERIVEYVRRNPVRAGLCAEPRHWPFSSAKDRFDRDGSECGLVGWLRDDWARST